MHLRRAAQAVGVLHRVVALPVAGDQRAAGQQPPQVAGAGQLPGVRADDLHPLVVRAVGAEQRLDAHRGADVGDLDQQADVVDRQRQQHLHRLGAVDQGQPLLGGQHERLDALLGQQLGARPAAQVPVAAAAQPALADQRLGQVRELREVAGRADRPLAGDHRHQVVGQQLEQLGRQLVAYAGVAAGQGPGPQQQQAAHHVVGQRLADPGAVRADQGRAASARGRPGPRGCPRARRTRW